MKISTSTAAAVLLMLAGSSFEQTAAFTMPSSSMNKRTAVVQLNSYSEGPRRVGDRYSNDRGGRDRGGYYNDYDDFFIPRETTMGGPLEPREREPRRRNGPLEPHEQAIQPMFGGTVQGNGSRKTWRNANDVDLRSPNGLPVDAELEWWEGPGYSPMRMKVYSQDGYTHGIRANSGFGGSNGMSPYDRGHALSIRNTGPMEFPISAGVSNDESPIATDPDDVVDKKTGETVSAPKPRSQMKTITRTIQGMGTIATFPFDMYVESVRVTLWSEGRPIDAKIELLQGPNNVKTVGQVYNDGMRGPFSLDVDTPGAGGVIQIENTGPMEFPINARVEPLTFGDGNSYYPQSNSYFGPNGMYNAPNNTPLRAW